MRLPFISDIQAPNVSGAVEQEFLEAQRRRLERISRAWAYYRGDMVKQLSVTPSTPHDDNIIIGMSRLVVDKGVAFLFGSGLEFEVGTGKGEPPEEKWLNECWQFNAQPILLAELATNGAVAGDTFCKMQLRGPKQPPRLINIDPATIYALWDHDDIDRVLEYRIEWTGIDVATGKAVARRQVVRLQEPTWVIEDYISQRNNTQYQLIGSENWPYQFCPVFHAKNLPAPNEFYGTADLETDLLHMNDVVNFIASNIGRIIRYHAHPKTWGTGFRASEMDTSASGVMVMMNEKATLKNLEMQSDLGSSQEYYRRMMEALHAVARVPEIATGRTEDLGVLSGSAIQTMYRPLVEKTDTKRLLYGRMLMQLNAALLEVGGYDKNTKVETIWPNATPVDTRSEAETGILKRQLGVSTESILTELGYNPEEEAEKRVRDYVEPVAEPNMGQGEAQRDGVRVQDTGQTPANRT